MKKKWIRSIAVLAMTVMACMVLCTGCGSSDGASGEDQEKVQAETLKVGMAGTDIKAVCVILAQELGLYEEEGVKVEFEKVSNLNDGVTALSQGKLDVLPFGFVSTATFVSQGTDVVVMGGTVSEGSQALVKPENKDMIQDIKDFKGKTVAYVRPETGQMIMKNQMVKAGLDIEKDVKFVVMDGFPAVGEAVSKGEADIGFVNSNFGYVAKQTGLEVAFDVADYVSDTVCCRETASREAVTDKRDAMVKFMTANLRAYEVYKTDQDTTIKTLMEYSGQDEGYVKAAMYNGVMKLGLDPNKKKVCELYEAMKQNGDISADTTYDIADYTDVTIYEDALEAMKDRFKDKGMYEELKAEFEKNNK